MITQKNNTILNFFENWCYNDYEIATYWLNINENTLSDILGCDNDCNIDKKLINIAKTKLAFEHPKNKEVALKLAFHDCQIRLDEWECTARNLLR